MPSENNLHLRIIDLLRPLPKPTGDLQNAIYREQQQQVVAMAWVMAVVMIAGGLLVSSVFWTLVPVWKIAVWYGPIVGYSLFLAYTWKRYHDTPPPKRVSGYFLRMGDRGALFIGTVWGTAPFLFVTESPVSLLFLGMVLGGMASGISSVLNYMPRMTIRFIVSSIVPLAIKSLMAPSILAYTVAGLGLTLMCALVFGSLRSYANLKRLLMATRAARSAKQGLVDAIEATPDAFVIYGKDGAQLTANASFRNLFPAGDPGTDSTSDSLRQIRGRWLMQSSRPTAQGGRVVVHTDVTTLKHRERELITAQREAEDADQAKTRFISTMSHELRTPLNIILGFSKLMTEDSNIKLSEKDVREYAESIHASGDDLLSLINDIIDYSKLGLDKYLLDRESIDIKTILVRATSLAANHVENVSIADVHISIAPNMGDLSVDPVAFRRILVNLISNALKFRMEDQRVIVRAGLHGDGQPFVAVRDFGSGMTEDQMKRAFEAFYQGDPELSRKHGGTGLGLTLSRHLARLHNGDILLKSRPGAGTTAMLILPADAHIARTDDAEAPVKDQKAA